MFARNTLTRKVQEHTDLSVVLRHAMERAHNANNSQECWDAWAEVERIVEEIKDTEQSLGGESVGIWS